MIESIWWRIGRRWWVRRIDTVLLRAYELGLIKSHTLHVLDAAFKYEKAVTE